MDIGLFKTFIAVVKNKSISKASETLYLTQPAVTKQIKLLEQLYDKKLFDRSQKRELRLTDAGRQLLDYANRIIGILNESLIALGIDPTRVDTISYGEDKPVATGHDEASWKQNRRGDFIQLTPPK